MEDIAPALYAMIADETDELIRNNKAIGEIAKRVLNGTATHRDTEKYALELGKLTSQALLDILTEENLPDGTLYYNIAERTVGEALKDNLKRVNDVGEEVQLELNRQANIGLKARRAKLNADRVDDLVSNIANCEQLTRARELLEEPIVNTTQSYADDFIKANADFQYDSGMTPIISRTSMSGCCEWCAQLSGTFRYPVNDEIYHRHENCRCIVEYNPRDGRGIQNSHTKVWRPDPADVERRKSIGM